MSTMFNGTDTTSPPPKLILKYGERKLLTHRLSKYEDVVTMARLEFMLSPLRPYVLLINMADIEPGSTAGLVEVSRLAWDLVCSCATTPVVELREVPGRDDEPEEPEARARFSRFCRNTESLRRELGLESEEPKRAAQDAQPAPKDAQPAPKDAKSAPKDAKSAPKDVKLALGDVKSAAKSDEGAAPKTPKSATRSPAARVIKTEPADTPRPPKDANVRTDGKFEISIRDELSAAKFLVKPTSLVDKVLGGWATHSGQELKHWRFEFGGAPLAAAGGRTIGDAGIAHGDTIRAFARAPSIPFSIDWSSSSSDAGTMSFTMQPHVKIQRAIDVWCERLGYKENEWVFEHCDEEIDLGEEPTLDDLGIEDGDAIYAVPAL